MHEGGISTPLIAHWPGRIRPGKPLHAPCHVADIVPTLLEAAGAAPLTELGGEAMQPVQGESLLGLLSGQDWQREQPIFFEHEGNSAIRLGQFKLVRLHGQDWELYDIEADRTELHDLARGDTARAQALVRQYQDWADKTGVLDWTVALPRLLAAWDMDNAEG